ncbi:bifunctional allantoicase/(S)-ureidoglycine aminohydrolase [Brevibacterium album]|uniref:bifunctional allantoicase/(S)-ureidoglycine aminohydrolase n=1 Tax=Brevibacterium album TaxID=417948 RepID=UPI00041D36A2|nr:bifunctional allantoicase/(S)-ureidoglycine aminohydrolase [Brevibacterium album]
MSYHTPRGGLPAQSELTTDRAVFTDAYAVLPARTMSDITASLLPQWKGTRAWVLARPLSGFAETFAQYLVEVGPGGGSTAPEPDAGAEGVLFAVGGRLTLTLDGAEHSLAPGGYAFLAPGAEWTLRNESDGPASFHWIRRRYRPADGIGVPESFVTSAEEVEPVSMPGTDGAWTTRRFADPDDLRHDMHVNIVTLQPGASIPFPETHVMEHGLFVLEGKAVYLLNRDWVEVAEGDFMWLRAFCPQACYAGGPGPFSYLLYKDVNRHAALDL